MADQPRRATWLESVGAWLHLTTPPRDVEVPPVPWRKLAIGGGIGVIVLGIALALLIPEIQSSKEERAAADRARAERSKEESIKRIQEAQAAHFAEAPELKPAADASPAEVADARKALLERAQASILADAQERAEKGIINPVSGPTTCEVAQGTPADGPVGVFDCFVVTSKIEAGQRNPSGALGYTFRAVLDYETFRYAWCKAELPPGEKSIQWNDERRALPEPCRAPRS
jgi:hypothetical protein